MGIRRPFGEQIEGQSLSLLLNFYVMQSIFQTYLGLGFDHISDLAGYDHILFIVVLCAIYRLEEWRKVAILVTAFTLGHSLTLGLAAMNIIGVNTKVVEFLIPLTIFTTSIYNVIFHKFDQKEIRSGTFNRNLSINYAFALIFGLIHGMGFSNFFRSLTMSGGENDLLLQLLAFNIGVELGQLAIVAVILLSSFLAFNVFRIKQREYNLFVSGAAAGLSLVMMLERNPFT